MVIEPYDTHFISLFHQPPHRYRTFKCTLHIYVPPAPTPLQNPQTHASLPYSSSPAIATEPLIKHGAI